MSKHTPGPWHAVEGGMIFSQMRSHAVARTFTNKGFFHHEEWPANARLIAAAPEMLETLKRIVDGSPNPPSEKEVCDLIAKAEGATNEAP